MSTEDSAIASASCSQVQLRHLQYQDIIRIFIRFRAALGVVTIKLAHNAV